MSDCSIAHSGEINTCRMSLCSRQPLSGAWLVVTLRLHVNGVNLLSLPSAVHSVARQGVARINHSAHSTFLLLVCGRASSLAAFMLNTVNSSSGSRKRFRWSITILNWLTDWMFWYPPLWFSSWSATIHISSTWDFSNDPLILSSILGTKEFLTTGFIWPKRHVNVFLITCF